MAQAAALNSRRTPAIDPSISFILSERFLSSANPFFLQLEIASAVLLGVGIVFESDKYPHSVHASAFWFVVVGVVLETVFSILLFASEERIASLQRTTIDVQQSTIIALEHRLAPRELTDDQSQKLSAVLQPFAGQKYDIIPYFKNTESLRFANQIHHALLKGGWVYEREPNIIGLMGGIVGVLVFRHPDADASTKEAAKALVDALTGDDQQAKLENEDPKSARDDKIDIQVGARP